jgi:hypothetical protein
MLDDKFLDIHKMDLQLEALENRGILEMLFEDGYGDKVYRFTHPFMREALYALQIFHLQRKPVHAKLISYLQENMIYNWQTEWNFEKEQTMLLQNLIEEHSVITES